MWFIFIAIYIVVLVLSISAQMAEGELQTSSDWVKVIFWPIYGPIYSIGILFGIFVYLTRKTYRGIIICVEDIKELFTDMWYAGEDDD